MTVKKKNDFDLSIIITAHNEGILIHNTINSVRRAISKLENNFSYEILLNADNPSKETIEYIDSHKKTSLKQVSIFYNKFGDLGLSRNFLIDKARGEYIANIDADDLMSKNWLFYAIKALKDATELTVAHSELTIEFEGANSLIIKQGELNLSEDALLSVFANRWNSVIVAPRKLLIEEPYAPNSPGYGYEDWQLNCRLIAKGVHNILIPKTAIFVRRKKSDSEWQRQVQSMSILKANPLLSFAFIRKLDNPFSNAGNNIDNKTLTVKNRIKKLVKKNPFIYKAAKIIRYKKAIADSPFSIVPKWLQTEWNDLNKIDNRIFLSNKTMSEITKYVSITEDHKIAGNIYKQIIDTLNFDQYDYLIFAPWLVKGGADKYTIDYANTISRLRPDKKVAVITTLQAKSLWRNRLDKEVGFIDFGNITKDTSIYVKNRILEHIVENSGSTHIHIINSELGYDFIKSHESYIKESNKKVIITSFSQSIDKDGKLFGYSHTHVPYAYKLASLITSDNQAVINMWNIKYGFDKDKMVVHRQPIYLSANEPNRQEQHSPLRVLWAARIAPEKQPELISSVGSLVNDFATIDVYGSIDNSSKSLIKKLPENVKYRGNFDGLDSISLDQYDVYLYTSLYDGMPNTLLEAASAKLPIIASAIGGIPELIINYKTGLLVNDIKNPKAYADAILSFKESPQLGERLGENAYTKIKEDFSPINYEKNINRMLEMLDY